MTGDELARWVVMAEQSTPVAQIYTTPRGDGWVSSLAGSGWLVIARGMRFEDARFHAEARQAVLSLAEEVERLRAYVEYVTGADHPRTYAEWVRAEEVEARR